MQSFLEHEYVFAPMVKGSEKMHIHCCSLQVISPKQHNFTACL